MARFPENPTEEKAPSPPSALGLVNVVLLVLIVAIGGLGLAALFSEYFGDHELVQTSHPYAQSKIQILSYHSVIESVGQRPSAEDSGNSVVHWNFPNSGSADIHFTVTGAKGVGHANLLWSRVNGHWELLNAIWIGPNGKREDIPLGPRGRFYSKDELALYHQADPLTPLGRATRANLQERFDEAIQEFTTVLEQQPNHVSALVGRGQAYFGRNKRTAATKDLKKALEIDPTNAKANQLLGEMEADAAASQDSP